jgi:hypothetical protein
MRCRWRLQERSSAKPWIGRSVLLGSGSGINSINRGRARGEDGKLKRARVLPRCRRSSLRRPGCILLSSAARTGARIYAADVPGEHRAAQPGGTVGSRFIAEPAPIYRGSTRSARCRHGPCAHSREAQEGCRSSPPSYSEAGCCPTCRAHATDRSGTNHEAIVAKPV